MILDKQGDAIINNEDDFNEWMAKRKNKKLYGKKDGEVTVDHVATANVLAKFIDLCPMDKHLKKVMLLRVGNPLINERALSHGEIALLIGTTTDEIIQMETAGKVIVGAYLQKVRAVDASKHFDKKNSNKKNITNIKNTLVNPNN